MQESNARTTMLKCLEGQTLAFEGVVSGINRYEYSSFMNKNVFGVTIKTEDTTNRFIHWQFRVKEGKDILKVISVGQKLRKIGGSKTFFLFVNNHNKQEFNIPYCK